VYPFIANPCIGHYTINVYVTKAVNVRGFCEYATYATRTSSNIAIGFLYQRFSADGDRDLCVFRRTAWTNYATWVARDKFARSNLDDHPQHVKRKKTEICVFNIFIEKFHLHLNIFREFAILYFTCMMNWNRKW